MNSNYFDEDNELTIKVVIIGNGAVGKSSLIQRYCKGIFTNQYKKTIGVDFLERTIDVNTQKIRIFAWDTAGQEEFDALTNAYYRGAHACVIAFSTTDRESFNSVTSWYKKVEYNCGQVPTILVQNKIDLLQYSTVNREEVNELSAKLKLPLFLTSSKENINIENAFYFLAKSYMDSLNVIDSPVISSKNVNNNNFLTNKSNQHPVRKVVPLRQINSDNLRMNANLYKSNLKNCWPTNALIINNLDNNLYSTATGKPKLVLGRHTNQTKQLIPVPIASSNLHQQHYFNRTLNKSTQLNPSTNCHYLTTQTNYLNATNHYAANQNKGRYFLLQNSNPINLTDNMYYTCHQNDYLKHYQPTRKFSFKSRLFSKCRII